MEGSQEERGMRRPFRKTTSVLRKGFAEVRDELVRS
jgi:hypothetical protein